MKKNIGLISLDSSLLKWLHEKLRISAPDIQGKEELAEGIEDLLSGASSSLMLELGDGETPLPVNDVIQCGNLAIYARSRKVTRDNGEISLTPKEFDILYFLARNRERFLQKSRYIRQYGKAVTCWMTAILWRLSENSGKRLNQIQTLPSIF